MNDYSIAMIFAEDLVRYVIETELRTSFRPTKSMSRFLENQQQPHPFEDKIGQSVVYTMLLQGEVIYSCFQELCDEFVGPASKIARLVAESVPHFFPHGYSHERFVAFCAMSIGVSVYFYQFDDKTIAEVVVGLIGNVLLAFILTGEFAGERGWTGLRDVCSRFDYRARMLWNEIPAEGRQEQRERVFGHR